MRSHFLGGIRELCGAAAELQLLVSFSIITIICGGKGIAHQSEVLGKWPCKRSRAAVWAVGSQGSAGVLCVCLCVCVCVSVCVCVLSLITSGLKREVSQALSFPALHPFPSRPVAFAPHLTTAQRPRSTFSPTISSPISPLQESPFTPQLCLTPRSTFPLPRPLCSPVVLETQIATETTPLSVWWLCVCVCVCIAEVGPEAKITDNPTEHWSGHDTTEATQHQHKQQTTT